MPPKENGGSQSELKAAESTRLGGVENTQGATESKRARAKPLSLLTLDDILNAELPGFLRLSNDDSEVELLRDGRATDYRIAVEEVRTREQLLAWVICLSDKTWITAGHLAALVKFTAERNKWKVRGVE